MIPIDTRGDSRFDDVVNAAVAEIAQSRQRQGAYYVNLPLLYPDGSDVTLKIEQSADGIKVSDSGFAYREAEAVGAGRSFARAAWSVTDRRGVKADRRNIFAIASGRELYRAICDVGIASWEVADRIYRNLTEIDEDALEERLRTRLLAVFGADRIEGINKLAGASSNEWEVSAVVKTDGDRAVFQTVADNGYSIYRTSTAFHDLAALEHPPRLIAVVRNKEAMGAKINLLAQAGRVIEETQPDAVFMKAAA
jgi:hypothetical protein